MLRFLTHLRQAAAQSLANDVFNNAKAAAYSGMLMLFPALLVISTILAQVPQGNTLVGTIRGAFEQILPADSMDMLQSYVLTERSHSTQLIVSAGALSVFAGDGERAPCCWCPLRWCRYRQRRCWWCLATRSSTG